MQFVKVLLCWLPQGFLYCLKAPFNDNNVFKHPLHYILALVVLSLSYRALGNPRKCTMHYGISQVPAATASSARLQA